MEFVLLYAGVVVPLTFMIIFIAEMLWIWHSMADFTRDVARYAATHCWMADNSNVYNYVIANVPAMIDQNQFQTGSAGLTVSYFAQDPVSGALTPFTCAAADCSAGCIPDVISVSVTNYQFLRFNSYFKLPPVTIPPFTTTISTESMGCDPDSGVCAQ
jgi:uncharacterized membrane protein